MENRITREMEKRIEIAVDRALDAFWEVLQLIFQKQRAVI